MSKYFDRVEAHLLDAVGRASTASPRRRRRWSSWWTALAAGTVASVAAAVVLTLALSATTSPPAYAVAVRADGSVTLTLNELVGIGPANARLAELGVRARLARREASCTTTARPIPFTHGSPPDTPRHAHETLAVRRANVIAALRKRMTAARRALLAMVRPDKTQTGVLMVIHPRAIPIAETLLLVFRRVSHTRQAAVGGSIALYAGPAPTCLPPEITARRSVRYNAAPEGRRATHMSR
jgi:hypothetical protein